MPKIKIEKVVSFSTEDPVHVASNLLDPDPSKKWKCAAPGEKSANVVLQLEKACIISSIDLGNEHSGYVEVLACRSSNSDEYKVLLTMSAFMNALDSRQSQNINSVKMFKTEDLSKPECNQKWDRIKIVCTQPFNRRVQYGLSFVALHSLSDRSSTASPTIHIGKFTLRPESPTHLSIGSIFAKRKEITEPSTKGAAAAIRVASSNPNLLSQTKSPISKRKPLILPSTSKVDDDVDSPRDCNRNDVLYTEDDDKPNAKIDKLIEKKRKEDEEKKKLEELDDKKKKKKDETPRRRDSGGGKNETPKNKKRDDESGRSKKKDDDGRSKRKDEDSSRKKKDETSRDKRKDETPRKVVPKNDVASSSKRKLSAEETPNKKVKTAKPTKPFNELLQGVSIVISGIQNPDRANIRTMALSMGALYKPEWNDTCTHLICAFRNTPKFNQVKGKGKIVTKHWVMDCHGKRTRLPWRRYALDPSDKNSDESEEEIFEEEKKEEPRQLHNEFDCDTDEEIERIQAQQLAEQIQRVSDIVDDEMNEADDDVTTQNGKVNGKNEKFDDLDLVELEDFFSKKTFFIDKSLEEQDQKLLMKYIVAYDGKIIEEIESDIDYLMTSIEGVVELKDQYEGKGKFLTADWIWECHNNKKIMPTDDFEI